MAPLRQSGDEVTRGSPARRTEEANGKPRPAWAQLLVALSPLSLVLAAYQLAHWINAPITVEPGRGHMTNRLGFGLHIDGPPGADRAMFGTVPTVWLQQRLVDGTGHWYDVIAALVYVSHFLVLPIVTALVWFRFRERMRSWVAAVLTLTTLGVVLYVVYPAGPPWLGARYHAIGAVDRVPTLGWRVLHLNLVGDLLDATVRSGNPVAAMPSLHAAIPALVLLFFWPVLGWRWRTTLILYAVLMAGVLVYTGEHYVIDVLVGWSVAAVAAGVGWAVRRAERDTRRSAPERVAA